ncbi:Zn-ribbon domain-containing OB-fold protein [Mycobacterium sp. 852002-51961_SCH5331710]|uniref:Zn-ribbon domain-containing OB-fold protein n=1 Tax=Mycobacterium sp. 852002-51961_SCH5331710 TaxID=1834105 RepID=UPI0007FE2FE2|nr:Zn-ribbon domain-containing OB-fold protein [Mycobacterium sp. 852002-51961_SCH5331710]OBB46007.1 nucleic acid-binding protein [Mycobacterium sp. 852002-51961_SCH5331710]
MASRLAPSISPDTEFFWSGLKEHELRIQRCTDCKTFRVPPRPMCGGCQSLNWDYVVSSGRGTVYSFVMPKYPPLPFLEYPYVVALIELDEGVRIVSNLCDIEPEAIEVGMPVEVFYEIFEALPSGEELVLHQFRPAR